MKAAESLMARLGSNMAESMAPANGAPVVPAPGVLPGGASKYKGASRLKDALAIALDQIIPDPDQPRKEIDPEGLEALAASLKARGQLQPARVRYSQEAGKWMIIAGERRYRAAIMAGLATLICIESTKEQSADDILEDQLVENCIREDLKPIEQAQAFKALMERRGWSYRQLGATLNLSSSHITRVMSLLDLPGDVQEKVEQGVLAPGTAYELSRVDDPEAQRALVEKVVAKGMNRAEVVEAVRSVKAKGKGRGAAKGKGKGRGGRDVPMVLKRRAANGCRVVVNSAMKHDFEDIIAALEQIAADLRDEWNIDKTDAA